MCIVLLIPVLFLSGAQADCISSFSISSGLETLVDRGSGVFTPAVSPTDRYGPWTSLSGADWVWESDSWSAGHFWFQESFFLPEWAKELVINTKFFVAVDDECDVYVNGKFLNGDCNLFAPTEYDITSYLVYGSDNIIRVDALNWWYWGGILYRIDVTFA